MITLTLQGPEALFALSAVQAAGAKAHHARRMLIDTGAPIDETSIAEMSAEMYDRLERLLTTALYPVDLRREDAIDEIALGIF